jgi:ATP-dependent Clp protease ATP-binding subunit ClpB
MIGAPPGYVGYEEGGALTEAVRRRPYQVILFDEIEKAHSDVFNVLLQVLDDGRLTDGHGRTVDFRNTLIVMTSNLGSEALQEQREGEDSTLVREQVMEAVRRHFRPEFLNRLDEIILFHPLSPEQLRQILGLMLKKEAQLLEARGIDLEVEEAAYDWMLAQNDHPEWGARPLRRIIRRYLREPLADQLLAADPQSGAKVTVGADGEGLTFKTL